MKKLLLSLGLIIIIIYGGCSNAQTIWQYTAATSFDDANVLWIQQEIAGNWRDRKVTLAQLKAEIGGGFTTGSVTTDHILNGTILAGDLNSSFLNTLLRTFGTQTHTGTVNFQSGLYNNAISANQILMTHPDDGTTIITSQYVKSLFLHLGSVSTIFSAGQLSYNSSTGKFIARDNTGVKNLATENYVTTAMGTGLAHLGGIETFTGRKYFNGLYNLDNTTFMLPKITGSGSSIVGAEHGIMGWKLDGVNSIYLVNRNPEGDFVDKFDTVATLRDLRNVAAGGGLTAGSVGTIHLQDGSITTAKLAASGQLQVPVNRGGTGGNGSYFTNDFEFLHYNAFIQALESSTYKPSDFVTIGDADYLQLQTDVAATAPLKHPVFVDTYNAGMIAWNQTQTKLLEVVIQPTGEDTVFFPLPPLRFAQNKNVVIDSVYIRCKGDGSSAIAYTELYKNNDAALALVQSYPYGQPFFSGSWQTLKAVFTLVSYTNQDQLVLGMVMAVNTSVRISKITFFYSYRN